MAAAVLQGSYTLYRIAVDLPRAYNNGMSDMDNLVRSLEPALAEALFHYNEYLGDQILRTFEFYPQVHSARLIDDESERVTEWQRNAVEITDASEERTWAMQHGDLAVGHLALMLNMEPVIATARQKLMGVLLASWIIALINLVILYWVAKRLVTTPIQRLSERVLAVDTMALNNADISRIESIQAHDEVLQLADSIAAILHTLADNMDEKKNALDILKRLTSSLEAQVSERTREYQEASSRAETANQAKTNFLNTMTHELRTPLNSIMGFTTILEKQEMTERSKILVNNILDSSRHLLMLINDIIDYIDLETKELRIQPFSVLDVVNSVVQQNAKLAEDKGLNLEWVTEDDSVAHGDGKRLGNALRHLVSNGIKFTDQGSVTLTYRKEDEDLIFIVKDTGTGMDLDRVHYYLEAFTQEDEGLARASEGTGLGLSIVSRICSKWGGQLTFDRNEPQGTVVTLRLSSLIDPPQDRIESSTDRSAIA